ncbi:MAG TPA: outer membrane beta-barrel protein, partial [Bacteroidota bacterium]|nr:outer membrane beta-barrel protein [Bacteroidota bacterium]
MKKVMLSILVLALATIMVSNSNAASKLSLSVGPDVLIPMGTFGDAVSTGFGGSVRGQYDINTMASVGLTVGYYIWSGKDVAGVSLPNAKGVPVRVFGKYYFMPEGAARFYGIAELGLFFSPGQDVTIGGITYSGSSSTDFNYAPGVGVELPLGSGSTKLDVSIRYDGIATSGSSSGSLGARVGINFPLG